MADCIDYMQASTLILEICFIQLTSKFFTLLIWHTNYGFLVEGKMLFFFLFAMWTNFSGSETIWYGWNALKDSNKQ